MMMVQPSEAKGMGGRPILVVDDQPKLAKLVAELLRRLGYPDVEHATSGEEACRMLRAGSYSLVISDLAMEPGDGLTLLRYMRTEPSLLNTPFILTETAITFEQVTLAHQMGADAFLLKPFDLTLFRSKLKSVMAPRPKKRNKPLDLPVFAGQELSTILASE